MEYNVRDTVGNIEVGGGGRKFWRGFVKRGFVRTLRTPSGYGPGPYVLLRRIEL